MDIQSKGTTWTSEGNENQEENINNIILDELNILCNNTEIKVDSESNKLQLEDSNVLYTIADSLMNNRQELQIRLNNLKIKPHIIAVTEVKNKKNESSNPAEFNIKGYCMYTNNFQSGSRGVSLYVLNTLNIQAVRL